MNIGISSACFYPLETEKSVRECGRLGFKDIEIFVNAHCELTGGPAAETERAIRYYGLDVVSIHPYTSFTESFVIFGNYPRRSQDGIDYYRRFFEYAARLGAPYFILHGAGLSRTLDGEAYFEKYAELCAAAKGFGVTVTHENVVRHRGQSPEFLCRLRDYVGEDFRMTFDIKQSVRAGEDPFRFVSCLGGSFANVHISDHCDSCDCMPPLDGVFDFPRFFAETKKAGYDGKYLIELYSHSFSDADRLVSSAERLEAMIKSDRKDA